MKIYNFLKYFPFTAKPNPVTPSKTDILTTPLNQKKELDPIEAKVMRDYNSPSVTARMKAKRAMQSPGYRRVCYGSISNNIDHQIIDTISEEKENPPMPIKVPTNEEIFKNCRVYVEIRDKTEDRSAAIRTRLQRNGIPTNEKMYKGTTHVVFKNGLQSTYNNAKKQNIPIVNILWIDACEKQKRLMDTSKYPISELHRYENPELYKKTRCRKSVTNWDDFLNPFSSTPDTHSKTTNVTVDMNLTNCYQKSSQMSLVESQGEKSPETPTNRSMAMSFSTPSSDTLTPKPKIVFNSLNRVSHLSRRSAIEIALQKVTDNCNKSLNSLNLKDLKTTPKAKTSLRTNLHKRRLIETLQDDFKENDTIDTPTKISKVLKESPKIVKQKTAIKTDKKVDDRNSIVKYFKVKTEVDKTQKTSVKNAKPLSPQVKHIVLTNMSKDEKEDLSAIISKLGGIVDECVTKFTTHVVSPNEARTMNILRGVIRACLIVNVDWIKESEKQNKFVDANPYQHSISDSNKYYERSFLGSKYKNEIFASHGLFFLDKFKDEKKYGYLKEVIELCSGKITNDVEKSSIIVYDEDQHIHRNVKQVKSSHIFDSAMKGKFIDV